MEVVKQKRVDFESSMELLVHQWKELGFHLEDLVMVNEKKGERELIHSTWRELEAREKGIALKEKELEAREKEIAFKEKEFEARERERQEALDQRNLEPSGSVRDVKRCSNVVAIKTEFYDDDDDDDVPHGFPHKDPDDPHIPTSMFVEQIKEEPVAAAKKGIRSVRQPQEETEGFAGASSSRSKSPRQELVSKSAVKMEGIQRKRRFIPERSEHF